GTSPFSSKTTVSLMAEDRTATNVLVDAQPVEQALVAAPLLPNPDGELQEDSGIELALELLARRGPDLADHAPTLADQDRLLRSRLGPDLSADLDKTVLAPLDLVHRVLDRVRKLLARASQNLLTDQLGEVDLARLVD